MFLARPFPLLVQTFHAGLSSHLWSVTNNEGVEGDSEVDESVPTVSTPLALPATIEENRNNM